MDQRQLSRTIQDSVKRYLSQDSDTDAAIVTDDDDILEDDWDDGEDILDNNNVVDHFLLLKASPEYGKLCEDFESEVVLAALISCHPWDLDGLTEWCYEEHTEEEVHHILDGYVQQNREEKKAPEATVPSFKKPRLEDRESKQGETPLSFVLGPQEALLSEQFAAVWTQFLDRAESLDIKECLSFQLLAGCLDDLAAGTTRPQRRFLAQFSEGSPNLVVCAEAEMHALALAFYMHDADKRLPGLDEVLLCQPDTPMEQVATSRSQCCGSVSGIRWLFDPWIRDG
jgi:hypothetical protein